jgi:hypothetical protein
MIVEIETGVLSIAACLAALLACDGWVVGVGDEIPFLWLHCWSRVVVGRVGFDFDAEKCCARKKCDVFLVHTKDEGTKDKRASQGVCTAVTAMCTASTLSSMHIQSQYQSY